MEMRALLKRDAQSRIRDLRDALTSGVNHFKPAGAELLPHIERVFQNHQVNVIHVAVSDGIQEISPTRELGLWEKFPLAMPIEDTLGVALASKRDDIAKKIQKEAAARNAAKAAVPRSDPARRLPRRPEEDLSPARPKLAGGGGLRRPGDDRAPGCARALGLGR
jgi:hypothetical protein